MNLKNLFFTNALLLLFSCILNAQPGAIDLTFNSGDSGFGNGDGASYYVFTTAIQADGKIIIGGEFSSYNDSTRDKIARLNTDGTIDNTFDPGYGANGRVKTTSIQADGRIIIGGSFSNYDGTTINHIARLNADGVLDNTFNPGTGTISEINTIAIQPDGKIVIGGNFSVYNGIPRNNIARLNANGSLDSTFNPGTGTNNPINSIVIQTDGKIIIGGMFTSYNGSARNRIARLNADGTLDITFNPGTGANSDVNTIAIHPNGKIIIGGNFTNYNSTTRNRIVRLNEDGTFDSTFFMGTGASNQVYKITIQTDGKIIIAGYFYSYNGTQRYNIARLNTDGTIDNSFNSGTDENGNVRTASIQSDGKIIIGGWFSSYNGTPRNNITRINADGTHDNNFNPGSGANNMVITTSIQTDGKIIIGGELTSYNGNTRNRIARINTDGTFDITFNPGSGANSSINATVIQSDGKIIIGGVFTSYNGTTRNRIARINTDGTLDNNFNPGTGTGGDVNSIAIQADGKIVIGGEFFSYNGTSITRIARLNTDGTLDGSFNPGTGADWTVFSTAVQADGKIIIGGIFSSYNNTPINRIARLNSDGSLDNTFNPCIGTSGGEVKSIIVQADGKIIIGGSMTSCNNLVQRIARLNADGTLDNTFNTGTGPNYTIYSTAIQADGKIIITGEFSYYNSTPRNRIARLNTDGSLDNTFNPGTSANNSIRTTSIQADGKIIIGGEFTSYMSVGRNRIARIYNGQITNAEFNNSSNIIIYPNPANKEVSIIGLQYGKIELLNIQGQVIKNADISEETTNIDISKLSGGVYTIKIKTNDGIIVKKIIKE